MSPRLATRANASALPIHLKRPTLDQADILLTLKWSNASRPTRKYFRPETACQTGRQKSLVSDANEISGSQTGSQRRQTLGDTGRRRPRSVQLAQQVVLAVSPGRLGVGAVPAPGGRGPGEGFQVRPVHRQRGAGVLELAGDAGFEQVVADRLQRLRRQPAGFVVAEGAGGQAEGPLGLPAGELVRPAFPVGDDAEPDLVVPGQAGQGLVHPGQMGGPPVSP